GGPPAPPGKMKPADAARLMASCAGDVVEPLLESRNRTDILRAHAASRSLLERGEDVSFAEQRSGALARHQAEGRLQRGIHEARRRRRDRARCQEFLGDQHGAAIKLSKMFRL